MRFLIFIGSIILSFSLSFAGEPVQFSVHKKISGLQDLNAHARLLAGLPLVQHTTWAAFSNEQCVKDYQSEFEKAWTRIEKSRLSRMRTWSHRELASLRKKELIFYPFSGPDALHVLNFYPWARTYILCGLEPAGNLPDVRDLNSQILQKEFSRLKEALHESLNCSFFITKEMEKDLKRCYYEGALPILMLYLARQGCELQSVEWFDLIDSSKTPNVKTHGVCIRFRTNGEAKDRMLYYLRFDLSNAHLAKTDSLIRWVQSQGRPEIYLKSASYLMHRPGFTRIRDFILKNAHSVLQDDSGIPQRCFDPKNWKIQLYGSYDKPIRLFRQYVQSDLKAQYAQSSLVQTLDFGLGYRHSEKDTTLILNVAKQ